MTASGSSAAPAKSWPPIDDVTVAKARRHLAELPEDATWEQRWNSFGAEAWPALFRLLDVAADLPRLHGIEAVRRLPRDVWPELRAVAGDLRRLQGLVDHPTVPIAAIAATAQEVLSDGARRELQERHCVHVDGLVGAAGRRTLEEEVARLGATREGAWGEVERQAAPELFAVFDRAVGSERFRRLTGYRAERDTYTLTLSLQNLDRDGIGWHRDLYWPREWVGEDVFAVLYGLDDDVPEKGGAFLYYVPWENRIYACYRRRHQATVLWNARETEGRILHAVSGYHGEDTARHLIILQCLRRR